MKKFYFPVFLLLFTVSHAFAQIKKTSVQPKLVIGLVIDQMRWDYLKRYSNLYVENGFKRLVKDGFNCDNTIIPYIPTYTAPGHTCIYTGSVPALHGIVGNEWYDKGLHKTIYCTSDSTVSGVGSSSSWGKMSPRNLWANTITDELRLSNNFKSKVIGISLKDRASILPAGHSANAAYWYDETVGGFITSTYYMKELPAWVKSFNKQDYPGEYMKSDWKLLLSASEYKESTSNNTTFSDLSEDSTNKEFPHHPTEIMSKRNDAFRYTPFANSYLLNFAKFAIENEHLGANNQTDFLTISISATDLIGHKYGPNSLEIEDTYLRLDRDLSNFLTYLDGKIGVGNYTLFLTADHGVSNVPAFLSKHNIPSGNYSVSSILKDLNAALENKYQLKNEVSIIENSQVYLSSFNTLTETLKKEVTQTIIDYLMNLPFVINAFLLKDALIQNIPDHLKQTVINGYNAKRSGDIEYITKPFNIDFASESFGTTHGSWNLYDSHIPLIFFGWGINKGQSDHRYYMTDIAATVAAILKIQMPDACIGNVIEPVVKKN